MLPITRLRRNLTCQIKINVADNDFDRHTWIWSNSTQECADIYRSLLTLPSSTYLNETSCVLSFTPTTAGYYALAVTGLDFENDIVIQHSLVLHFLIPSIKAKQYTANQF